MSKNQEYAVYLIARFVIAAVCLLPLKVCFLLGWLIGGAIGILARGHRKLVRHNLNIAFGDEKSPRELNRIASRHFRALGANILSGIKLTRMSEKDILEVVDVSAFVKEMQDLADSGRGVIMVLAHLGNWEATAQLAGVLPWTREATLYQKLGNDFIDAHVRKLRQRFGLRLFERKEGFSEPLKHLRGGGLLGVLIDQHAGDGGIWVPLFGRLASTSPLAAMLAIRTESAMLATAVITTGFARWELLAQPLEEVDKSDIPHLTARLNAVLEKQIRRSPADWFWVHNRWRTPNPDFLLSKYKRGVFLPEEGGTLKPFRILIRSSNWLGDCVMTIPAVRAFKQGRPDAHVTILTQEKLEAFWKHVPWVDEVVAIKKGESVFSVGRRLRKDNYDAGILFPNSLRSALEIRLAGIPRRVGYGGHHRSRLLNQIIRPVKKPGPPPHQVEHYLRMAQICGAETDDISVSIRTSTTPSPQEPIEIGLCPGAEYGPAKRWLPERFAEAAKQVSQRRACKWVLFGTAGERDLGEKIAAVLGDNVENLIGQTTLEELINRLSRCRVLLTNDTGTMHLAAMLGVPVVAVFGSTEPTLTGPLGRGHQVIRHQVECSPCFLRKCPIDFRCMRSVEVDEVVEAVIRQLETPHAGS